MSSSTPPATGDAGTLELLSNGHYSVMLSAAGTGFSRWHGLAVTRWREDPVADPWGSYVLLRDEDNGAVWSLTPQPFGCTKADDRVTFDAGCVTFERDHEDLHGTLEVAVAAEADIELRRITLRNDSDQPRTVSLTSYAELVVGPIGADNAHPAFSKMFVQTEWDAEHDLLLATRRRQDRHQTLVWAAHAAQVEGDAGQDDTQYESDRASFLGRARTLRNAREMQPDTALSSSSGCVLDPVFSLRRQVTIAPGDHVRVLFWMQLADSREGALALAAYMQSTDAGDRLFVAARKHAQAQRAGFGIDAAQAACFGTWLRALLLADPAWRAAPDMLACGHGGAPTLWGKGISGDRPIMLVYVDDASAAALARVREVLLAQRWWQTSQMGIDVVLLNRTGGDPVQTALAPLLDTQHERLQADGDAVKAELFCLCDSHLDESLHDGLLTVARVVLRTHDAVLAQPARVDGAATLPAPKPHSITAVTIPDNEGTAAKAEFHNGLGGFVDHGRAYRIDLNADQTTPAPWVNVMANASFGCMVSDDGGGYAWSVNSQKNTLTPWPNDPVSDTPHDILYLRDLDSDEVWSATALPIRVTDAHYGITHGKGWSRFDNDAHGIDLELTQCVPVSDPVKLSRLRLRNRGQHTRRLSITGYVQWSLGGNGDTSAPFVVTSLDSTTGALLARNRWRADFADHVAFFDLSGMQASASGDRAAFLGPFGDVTHPAVLLSNAPLDGRVGAGLDPCGALQSYVELPPDTQVDLQVLLGDGVDADAATALIEKYRKVSFDAVLDAVRTQWDALLDTVQVRTPDRAMDIMLNDWLPYQVLSCRVWARTAYYQASGAYGFRDQLQDVGALCLACPDVVREHLLRSAGRQFPEGDVQHWWLPPSGQGVRTRICDDRVWLPYITAHYVAVTGDNGVLDATMPFLEGAAVAEGATDAFYQPSISKQQASVYEHCARAIDISLACGAHGLPLMGTGDWNDGMNAVGAEGRGESSWMGWFLLATIEAFLPHAERHGDNERVAAWRACADTLRPALEQAWDGQWYRRGYYDDGTPLGSDQSTECKIDSIAQSWSLIAGATNAQRSAQAMASTDRILIDHKYKVARLFTPPFDQCEDNPGYIKGYPPGVRENGGQYTHGAIWSVFAWAALGEGDHAGALFDLLSPVRHADTPAALERYKVEPYVSCADVYSVAPHVGRGGWTWYSGSAGWLYRAGLEAVLGFYRRGDHLLLEPCIPKHWPGFVIAYQHRHDGCITRYQISVDNPDRISCGIAVATLDGKALKHSAGDDQVARVPLVDDGQTHRVHITLGLRRSRK